MSKRYYISKIVGTGDEFDPFRPKVADHGVPWVGSIDSDPLTGHPLHAECLVLVNTINHGPLLADPDIDVLPEFPLDGKLSAINIGTKNQMLTRLAARGFNTSEIGGGSDSYRDTIINIGLQRSPAFNIDSFDVE